MADTTYNGWTNYETWAVALWMDNEESSYSHWRQTTKDVLSQVGDKRPNRYMDKAGNARATLSALLKDAIDTDSGHPVFDAANGSVYADLLNAALASVNWLEIAEHLLADVVEDSEDTDA